MEIGAHGVYTEHARKAVEKERQYEQDVALLHPPHTGVKDVREKGLNQRYAKSKGVLVGFMNYMNHTKHLI